MHRPRDPRFDGMAGTLNDKAFRHSFSFIGEMKEKELEVLRKDHRRTTDEDKKRELQAVITQYQQEAKQNAKASRMSQQMSAWKKSERERITQGKQPYFLKQSTVKQLAMVDEFEELKKKGKLESYMAKRRKQNAAKDHRYVPYARRPSEPTD